MADSFSNGTAFATNPSAVVDDLTLAELMLERGTSGLRRYGGYVQEELLTELSGQRGMRMYREMGDNCATAAGCLFAAEMLIRNATQRIAPADDSTEAAYYAQLVEDMLFQDLDMPWSMQTAEEFSMLKFGFSYLEIVFKRRLGADPPPLPDGTPGLKSRFNDGLIGFGKIAQRAQDTVLRWEFDSTGSLAGMHQMDPFLGRQAYLPYEKCLLFRPTSWKDNPEGRSILRSAYTSYYWIKHLQNTEGIGAERHHSGLAVFYTPPQWWSASASPHDLAQLEMTKRVGRNLRNDEQSCLVLPALYDQNNNRLLSFELVASPGTGTFEVGKIIERHELRIAQTMLADMIFLGHEATGSWALHSGKTNLLSMALGGFMQCRADVYNRRAFPLLWKLNAFPEQYMPTLEHGDIETVDLQEVGQFIKDYAQAGFDVTDLENHVRSLVDFPLRDPNAPVPQAQEPRQDDEEDTPVATRGV